MNQPRQTKAERKTEAREKARLMREQAERKAKRQRVLIVTVTVVAVLALVLGVGAVVRNATSGGGGGGATLTSPPQNVGSKGEVTVGNANAPVTVSVYLDYQCPACKAFEDANAGLLDEYVKGENVKVEYHPVSILDRFSSGTQYSTRSASAAFCVAEGAPQAFAEFSKQMFANQPQEGGTGLPDDKIASIATLAGAPESVGTCITDGKYKKLAADATEQASKDGLQGTPWVKVQGEEVQDWGQEQMQARIDAALKAAGVQPGTAPSGSASPTGSPTTS
jgi:protein-disulfide isomerase